VNLLVISKSENEERGGEIIKLIPKGGCDDMSGPNRFRAMSSTCISINGANILFMLQGSYLKLNNNINLGKEVVMIWAKLNRFRIISSICFCFSGAELPVSFLRYISDVMKYYIMR
jgi:hypothetical protein